jgi:chromosome segregation ATPase
MSELSKIVESLENKLGILQQKLVQLQAVNHELQRSAADAKAYIGRQQDEIAVLKQQNESLRMANSLLGSDESKRETKLKINSLIREIDYCIAQLSD